MSLEEAIKYHQENDPCFDCGGYPDAIFVQVLVSEAYGGERFNKEPNIGVYSMTEFIAMEEENRDSI